MILSYISDEMELSLEEILQEPVFHQNETYVHQLHKLLKEDFCGPLRKDLKRLFRGESSFDNLTDHGVVELSLEKSFIKVSFIHDTNLKLRNLDNRLQPGCLVVLHDESDITLLGTVLEKIVEKHVSVSIELAQDNCVKHSGGNLRLYEYTVYYEAYKYSLENLQQHHHQVPFQELFSDGSSHAEPKFDMFKEKLISMNGIQSNQSNSPDVSSVYKELFGGCQRRISPPTFDPWESESWNNTQFDESQRCAILQCLSRQVSLIQGPPGTGKSFVGSQVVNILLQNQNILNSKLKLPILVICYTNSALDQFLEILLKFTCKIIRIGSRSKSVSLENHNLQVLKSYAAQNMMRKQSVYEQEKELVSLSKTCIDKDLEEVTAKLKELRLSEDASLCRKAELIGLTVTGAAKHRQLLERIRPSIVLIEEAAEILEAQLVASLPSSCRHLVMIGDHKQLRPSTANHALTQSHPHWPVSLFEKLIQRHHPFVCLNTQHRMAPDIARLLSPVYSDLVNHPSVLTRPVLPVLNTHVLFLDHNVREDSTDENRSKTNSHEAAMVVGLARLLNMWGVRLSDMVILTTYTGQLQLVRRILSSHDISVETDTVDNYQGEEKEVVLLSLVRSGADTIGFMALDNRVTVALSRARAGLVMVGAMDTLCGHSRLWSQVRDILVSHGQLVTSVQFRCHCHGSQVSISQPQHFPSSPLGGCDTLCQVELRCGHGCHLMCHPDTVRHKCDAPCAKLCHNNVHRCPKKCDELCGLCLQEVEMELSCGHMTRVSCSTRKENVTCTFETEFVLDCGHIIRTKCGFDSDVMCNNSCNSVLTCGHSCNLPCHYPDTKHQQSCQQQCTKTLCHRNHPCPKKCHDEACPPCQESVKVTLPCSHSALVQCSEDISNYECTEKCTKILSCGHQCRGLCYEECGPCNVRLEQRTLECGHSVTNVRCGAVVTCSQPCERMLPCGHRCSEQCGQPCSVLCMVPVLSSLQQAACSHAALVPCHAADGGDTAVIRCEQECGQEMLCGHVCSGQCGTCSTSGLHPPCEAPCGRQLVCGHPCEAVCGQLCPPCTRRCLLRCPHGQCKARCGEECTLDRCKEKCTWRCQHKKCTKKCNAVCNRTVCEERCTLKLECKHQCSGKCGEPCFCEQCSNMVTISDDTLALPCGCLTTKSQVIEYNENGMVHTLNCPTCKIPISHNFQLKQHIQEYYSKVQTVSDKFFAHNMKMNERKKRLVGDGAMPQLKDTKSHTSSTTLAMVEVRNSLASILKSVDLQEMSRRVESFQSISINNFKEIKNILEGNEDALYELNRIKLYSFEMELWRKCSKCGDMMQWFCDKGCK